MSISFRAAENGFTHVCAHRGYSLLFPENTLLAFEGARLAGATTCEIDLVLTRDGEAIVLHDAMLDRTTDGHGFAADHDLAEIRSLNAAAGYDGGFEGNIGVPTFSEVLDWARKTSVGLVVEMKEREQPELLTSRVISILQETDSADQVMLLSFNHVDIKRIKEQDPRLRTEAIVHARHVDIVEVLKASGADSVSIELEMFAAEDAIALHEAGLTNRVHLPVPDELARYWAHGRDYRSRIGEWLAAGLIDSVSGDDVAFLRKLVDDYPIEAKRASHRLAEPR
jgi:glycerophosphoryl diester phosphodiesterase